MDDANQEYIRSYWRKELTETERQAFEQKCVEDENFASSVAQFMQLKHIAREGEKDRLKELYKENKQSNRKKLLILIIGIALVSAFLFKIFFLPTSSVEDNLTNQEEKIFAMLVEEHQDANRGDNDLSKSAYRKWFEEEKYDTLLFELEAVNLSNVVNVDALIWAVQSLYIQNKNTEVVDLIDFYMENNVDNIARKDELLWLQTLAYLKINNQEKAKSNLQELIDQYRLYQKEAKELLKYIK